MKADIMILDLLAHNNWERPVYFAITVGSESYLNLEDYFQLEGMAYRLVPVKNPKRQDGQMGEVNSDAMYDNLVNKFKWGNMSDPRVYLDQNNLNMTMNLRNNFGRLAETLLEEGKRDSAMNVLDKCIKEMPDNTVPYNIMMIRIAEMYYGVANYGSSPGRAAITDPNNPSVVLVPAVPASPSIPFPRSKEATEKADQIMKRLGEVYENDFNYYASLANSEFFKGVQDELGQSVAVFRELERIANNYERTEIASIMRKKYEAAESKLYSK
jgi:tetratricopeptide (TPR) repeat protein